MKKPLLALIMITMYGYSAHSQVMPANNIQNHWEKYKPITPEDMQTQVPVNRESWQQPPMQQAELPSIANGSAKVEDENPAEQDQSTDRYVNDGYDAEVFPHKDPNHFIF